MISSTIQHHDDAAVDRSLPLELSVNENDECPRESPMQMESSNVHVVMKCIRYDEQWFELQTASLFSAIPNQH